jgi:hypothetical protein
MKTIAATILAVTAILTFSSCKTIVEPQPSTRTTTTEETTIQHPNTTTTETHVRTN